MIKEGSCNDKRQRRKTDNEKFTKKDFHYINILLIYKIVASIFHNSAQRLFKGRKNPFLTLKILWRNSAVKKKNKDLFLKIYFTKDILP